MLREKVTNLFVLGVAIILVFIAKKNYKDYFVPDVRRTPIGNGQKPVGVYPTGQPMQFKEQMWPVRVPYQPMPQQPCNKSEYTGRLECPGATGVCQDGICQPKKFNRTVFNVDTPILPSLATQ